MTGDGSESRVNLYCCCYTRDRSIIPLSRTISFLSFDLLSLFRVVLCLFAAAIFPPSPSHHPLFFACLCIIVSFFSLFFSGGRSVAAVSELFAQTLHVCCSVCVCVCVCVP